MARQSGHTGENEDDAMFTKKPLGGMSCASCEKNIINLYGHKADYLPWSRFPFRDPSERIAKVGQGFSKMLSMMNPDSQMAHFSSTNNLGNPNLGNSQSPDGYNHQHVRKASKMQKQVSQIQSNTFYNGEATIEEHHIARAGLNTADGGMRMRPTSASIKKKQLVVRTCTFKALIEEQPFKAP